MTPPRPEHQSNPFEGNDCATENADLDASEAAQSTANESPKSSQRFQTSRDLADLRRQLAAPRTPLIPSMDLFQSQPPSQQKSIVDTLPPMESVPPPAPYLAEAPPARPSVVPPVRQPRSDAPPPIYVSPQRQSNAPPPPNHSASQPPPAPRTSNLPPQPARNSNPPPAISDSGYPRARFSSAPPPNSSTFGGRHPSMNPSAFAPTDPHGMSADALRRQAATIPADANSPSLSPPPYDPTQPIPSLRVPSFAPQSFLAPAIRQQENRRIGGVAFVLLVGLLIVAGAIMGIDYAAKSRSDNTEANRAEPSAAAPRVKLERLKPNVLVASSAGGDTLKTPQDLPQAPMTNQPAEVEAKKSTDEAANGAPSVPVPALNSPWNHNQRDNSRPKTAGQRPNNAGKSRKRNTPNSIDTETPLIMD